MTLTLFIALILLAAALIYLDVAVWDTEIVSLFAVGFIFIFCLVCFLAPVKHVATLKDQPVKVFKTDRMLVLYSGDNKYENTNIFFYERSAKIKSVDLSVDGNVFGCLQQTTLDKINLKK